MIQRTYGRRGRGLTRGCSEPNRFRNGVMASSSHDCSEDVYKFSFPPQDCWVDPYNFESSQESKELEFLSTGTEKDYDGGVWNSKKAKVIDLDPEPQSSNSDRESEEFAIVEVSDFRKSRKSRNLHLDPNVLSSSRELVDLEIPLLKKGDGGRMDLEVKGKAKKRVREGNGVVQKKRKKNKKKIKPEPKDSFVELTTTLMETQEGGEMMEHLDEINFALDGLKKAQPFGVRRASLLSLLSNCGTMQQRRLLRIHGMSKTIIDAIMELNLDDPPSNVAAAALFYILTCDGQDDHLLGSPASIQFLVKLLKPVMSSSFKDKVQPLGSRLIGLSKNAGLLQDSAQRKDSSSSSITLKVRDILVNCKEMKQNEGFDGISEDPELNHKWVGLLILEKACSSKISIEETSGTLRKSGGKFKEKLREMGGLDTVFEVARRCHCTLEDCSEKNPSFSLDSKDIRWRDSVVLLLKCLKIMENATFLSKDNQGYLLRMKGDFNGQQAPRSFLRLVLSVIRILSDVSLQRSYLKNSLYEKLRISSYENIDSGICSLELASQKSCTVSQSDKSQLPSVSDFIKSRIESSQSGSCSGTSQNPEDVVRHIISDYREAELIDRKNQQLSADDTRIVHDSHDPFAFDDDDFEPSKWDVLSGSVTKSLSQDSKGEVHRLTDIRGNRIIEGVHKPDLGNLHSQDASCSSAGFEDKSNLIADCLLTAVKVLMNMSNENPEGCEQIAKFGGLEIMSSLIAGHFPLFSSVVKHDTLPSESGPLVDNQHSNSHLTDQELDLLIAILGSLVNLVEKDVHNRSRLAKAMVSLPRAVGFRSQDQIGVISLFCLIFLMNQAACSEAAQEDKYFSLEDEESLLQGEKEAEKMIVEAYSALLLAFLSTESKIVRNSISDRLPGCNLRVLVPVLERFVEFHRTLDMISPETHSAVLDVIESCRVP